MRNVNMTTMTDIEKSIISEVVPSLHPYSSVIYTLTDNALVPVEDDTIQTAAISFSSKETEKNLPIKFSVNPEFWESLDHEMKVFVIIHETLHMMLYHGIRGHKFFESLPKSRRYHKYLNIAMDICINHMIVESFMTHINRDDYSLLKEAAFIETVFKDKATEIERDRNFAYYYEKIMEVRDEAMENAQQEPGEQGEGGEYDGDGVGDYITFGDVLSEMSEEEIENLQKKIQEAISEAQNGGSNKDKGDDVGNAGSDKSEMETVGYSIDDMKTPNTVSVVALHAPNPLRKMLNSLQRSSAFKAKSHKKVLKWYGVERRYSGVVSKELKLPSRQNVRTRRSAIVAYCDFSGSCAAVSDKFISTILDLRNEDVELRIYAFASNVAKVEVKDGKVTGNIGYGTNINKVLDHYEKHVKDIPHDAVFCLTDGQYMDIRSYPQDLNNKKWVFAYTSEPSEDRYSFGGCIKNALPGAKEIVLPID